MVAHYIAGERTLQKTQSCKPMDPKTQESELTQQMELTQKRGSTQQKFEHSS